MAGVADSTFSMVKADMIVSPPAMPIIPIGVGAWVLLIFGANGYFREMVCLPGDFQTVPNHTPWRGRESG